MASVASKADSILSRAPQSAAGVGMTTPLLAVAALTAVASFVICLHLWLSSSRVAPAELLQMANRQFSVGNPEIAGKLAALVQLAEDADPALVTQRHFLIGAGHARQAAGSAGSVTARPVVQQAIKHLQLASANWPPGREDEGDRLLGEMFYQAGDLASAVPPLQSLLERNPTYRDPLIPTLVRCLLRGSNEQAQQALQLIDERLQLPVQMPADEQELQLLRGECLTRLGRYEAARQQLRQSLTQLLRPNADADPAVTARSVEETELLLAAVDISEAIERFGPGNPSEPVIRPEAERFLAAALKTLLRLQRNASPEVAVRTSRWLARGMLCAGDPSNALSQLAAVRLRQPFRGEATAASLEEIEYLIAQGSHREAMQTVRYMIAEIGSEENFDASVIDLTSFRQRLQNLLAQLREQGETATCIAIAKSLAPLFSPDHAHFEEGLALREAAAKLAPPPQAISNQGQRNRSVAARALYAQAGNAFEAAARLRYESNSYSETLWEAIDAYQQSGQFARSVELLSEYLRFEQRIRHPRALIAQGRALLASGDPAAAIKPLTACVEEFPRDPLCYDARLLAAKALAELDQLEQAKGLLDVNLTEGAITPQSLTWKESLLTLGEVLWRRCHEAHASAELKARLEQQPHPLAALQANQPAIEEAIMRLKEAMQRYWPDPQAMQSAALLAKANCLAAALPGAEAELPDVLAATRRRLLFQREQFLQSAIDVHRQIRKELSEVEDERVLEPAEQVLMQTALMGEADALFERGQFEPSADAYRTISLRYMNEPPALEAMVGQARCLRGLDRHREARLVIRQAAVVLGRIPSEWDPRFKQITRYDRRGWEELLAWMDSGPMPKESDS